MKRLAAFLFAGAVAGLPGAAQTNAESPAAPTAAAHPPTTTAAFAAAFAQLTQSNHDLLDLLKKQQAVLEDIQYDRRLQSRQIESLEERLEETLQQNAQLQSKVASLEATLSTVPPAVPGTTPTVSAGTPASPPSASTAATEPASPPPATPNGSASSHIPAPDPEGPPGSKCWRRLFTLSGALSKTTDLFPIQGRQWRVVWYNQDKNGKAYENTSALFINAFPKDDTIPQKVCAKLGSGGDAAELDGPGNYYLKIEASGGSWELAVEDYR